MSIPELSFMRAELTLRPPRVVILVRDDARWRDWVMFALEVAGGYWGGAGFILVPYDQDTQRPDDTFAELVRTYDPDHVMCLGVSASRIEEWYPGTIRFDGVEDMGARRSLIANMRFDVPELAGSAARDEVATWCSPLRADRLRDKPSYETQRHLRPYVSGARGLAPAASRGTSPSLAASSEWRSDVGLLAAMRLGVAVGDDARSEPDSAALTWLVRGEGHAPSELVYPPAATGGEAEPWFLSGQRLLALGRGYFPHRLVVVVGDTARDFALALAYDRMFGRAIWLTSSMRQDDDSWKDRLLPELQLFASEAEMSGSSILLTSGSVATDELQQLATEIADFREWVLSDADAGEQLLRDSVQVGAPPLDDGLLEFSADEHIGVLQGLPVSRSSDGTRQALLGLDAPVPSSLVLPADSGHVPYWYVDVTVEDSSTPVARDLPVGALVAHSRPFPEVNLRASRSGYSYAPHSLGFVPAGALLTSRLGRPVLVAPSMTEWVRAMASQKDITARPSAAGRRADLVSSRLGSRADLLKLVTPGLIRLLKAFQRRERTPRPDERDPQTVVLSLDPFLSFEAMETLTPAVSPEDIRDLVDQLIASEILRRGLILGCSDCQRVSFVSGEKLGSRYDCSQCGARNELVSARWNRDGHEPRWFYDLYAPLRDLVAENGDVVLLAASRLRADARKYADTSELEFIDPATDQPFAEIDLIASVNREVVIVEAKSNGSFGSARSRKSQVGKLLRVASLIRADRIVLATSKATWTPSDVEYLRARASEQHPFRLAVEVTTDVVN